MQKHRLLKFLMLKLMLVEFLELKLGFLSFLSLGFTGDGLEWFKGRWVKDKSEDDSVCNYYCIAVFFCKGSFEVSFAIIIASILAIIIAL